MIKSSIFALNATYLWLHEFLRAVINIRLTHEGRARSWFYHVCKTDGWWDTVGIHANITYWIPTDCFSHVNESVPDSNRAHDRWISNQTGLSYMRWITVRACQAEHGFVPQIAILHFYPHSIAALFCTFPHLRQSICCKLDAAVAPTIKDDQSRWEGKLVNARSCPRFHWWPCSPCCRSFVAKVHNRNAFARGRYICARYFFYSNELF